MAGSYSGLGGLFGNRFAGGLNNRGGRTSLFGFWIGGFSRGGAVTPVVTTTYPGGGVEKKEYDWHVYRRREEVKKRLPKKRRKLVDELDEMLVQLQERIVEVPQEIVEEEPRYLTELRRGQAIAEQSLIAEFAASEIRAQVARLRAIIEEIDDEEAILLALH